MRIALVFLALGMCIFAEILCLPMEDYQFPATAQEETEKADPPEDADIDETSQKKPPPPLGDDGKYPPKKEMQGRASFGGETFKWKILNFHIDRDFYDKADIKIINKAAFILYTILKPCGVHIGVWKEGKTPFGDYVEIINGTGCLAGIGRQGGRQKLVLEKTENHSCVQLKIVLHEMLHSLGFGHEHSRPDRDEHIEILWDNITPEGKDQYEMKKNYATMGFPYNENSIMHYKVNFLAIEEGLQTMRSKHGKELGHTFSNPQLPLEQMDIDMIKKVYCNQ